MNSISSQGGRDRILSIFFNRLGEVRLNGKFTASSRRAQKKGKNRDSLRGQRKSSQVKNLNVAQQFFGVRVRV